MINKVKTRSFGGEIRHLHVVSPVSDYNVQRKPIKPKISEYPNQSPSSTADAHCGLQKPPFSGRAAGYQPGPAVNNAILQLNVEGITSSRLSIIEQLAFENKASVVLQETHCTMRDKLVLPNYALAGYTASGKREHPFWLRTFRRSPLGSGL